MSGDPGLQAVLDALQVRPESVLGWGGEARVYALDARRVLRVLHGGGDAHGIRRRQELVRELGSKGAPFLLPNVLAVGEVAGRFYSIERRLPGVSVSRALEQVENAPRARLVERHLDAAAALGSLHLERRGWFGELIAEPPLRASGWSDYLFDRAAVSLRASTPSLQRIDPRSVTSDLPDAPTAAFVHLDAFTGNMLTAAGAITAVLDFGATCVTGDARFDPVACAVYLSTPFITPMCTARDVDVANSWLRAAGLLDLLEPVRRWLAAFWAFAVEDTNLLQWCHSVLVPGG